MMLPTLTSRRVSVSSPPPSVSRIPPKRNTQHRAHTYSRPELELDDEGTRISLTIVDTPGFGDQIDNEARHVHRTHRRWPID